MVTAVMPGGVGLVKSPVGRFFTHTDRLMQRTIGRSLPPAFYELVFRRDLRAYPAAPPVFRTRRVPTETVTQVTGRYEPWRNRPASLGRVIGGDWDRDHGFALGDDGYSYAHVDDARVVDWILYDAINRRVAGERWEDTQLVELALSRLDDRPLSRRYRSETAIQRWLMSLDSLIDSIREHGLLSNWSFHEAVGRPSGVLERHVGEVCVDVGRDGELLFVNGKHRLCIAKVLGVDSVPVAPLVYHRQWAEQQFTA